MVILTLSQEHGFVCIHTHHDAITSIVMFTYYTIYSDTQGPQCLGALSLSALGNELASWQSTQSGRCALSLW